MLCVWNEVLIATSGAKVSTAHWMISTGVFASNCSDSESISGWLNIGENYNRYNEAVDDVTVERLISLNRRFYTDHGRDFSETRRRLQPGVLRLLDTLHGNEAILDLGCGNGELVRTLSRRGHRGRYVGLDFSLTLLNEARRQEFSFPVQFLRADLAELSIANDALPVAGGWSLITAFAVLHHLPGFDLRLALVRNVYDLLRKDGLFIHSNWQFLSSPRLKRRIQPWNGTGVAPDDVDASDYLLDWKFGQRGLRYIHHFEEGELAELARLASFEVLETFYSDGENKKLSIYQVWRKAA